MSLRSTITRLGIVAAAGALVTSAAVTPALADNDWGSGGDSGSDNQQSQQSQQSQESGQSWQGQQTQQNQQSQESGQNWQGQQTQQNQQNQESGQNWQGQENQQSWEQGDHDGGQRLARGVVTASELNLRSAPNRGSQVIRVAHRGERVSIFCKTPGQSVDGNRLWYLLTDGTWAWGSARYIETIGTPPRWC
ncbi:SH3 domain-containing protein [Streptomyces griseorubiginosus]|uniref:SH3 domain-containing protein n=1 Tax=Streptomyces griseorubiginosus TaxID=67304 RepID=UPI001AD6D7FD|nr:SH3 domain-containing protein [Streptomyces griseorubiginosus]MBO4260294.1 SH3 domain-containing protein [Streptomyces griseorubiginosus]